MDPKIKIHHSKKIISDKVAFLNTSYLHSMPSLFLKEGLFCFVLFLVFVFPVFVFVLEENKV